MRDPTPSSLPLVAHDMLSRTDELLRRYLDDGESLTSPELLELAAAILEKSLAKQKYRRVRLSGY